MIGIVDYGMGNLRSVQKGLQRVGADDAQIIREPDQIEAADKLVVPGVGAIADAMANLHERQLADPIRQFVASGRPFLGICLGFHMLFDASEEDGEHACLGIIPGRVVRFQPEDPTLKVPHMGWNTLRFTENGEASPLFRGLRTGCAVYFVHAYYPTPEDQTAIATTTDYGGTFCSAVRRDNVFAVQFHPEKSQRVGLKMLTNFAAL